MPACTKFLSPALQASLSDLLAACVEAETAPSPEDRERMRKSLKSVRYGVYKEHFPLSNTLYCYTRELKCEKLLVLCSFSDKPQNLRIPAGYDLAKGELILGNYENRLPKILQPYECRVYRF